MRAMPKTLDTQGFSGLREEVVRSEGRSSRTPVLQEIITALRRLSNTLTGYGGGIFYCGGLQTSAPVRMARRICGNSFAVNLFDDEGTPQNHGFCGEIRPLVAHPSSGGDNYFLRELYENHPEMGGFLFFCTWLWYNGISSINLKLTARIQYEQCK